jgi:PTH2 family peptidyl-tRNA hydrolase
MDNSTKSFEEYNPKMYIIMNTSVKMKPGKMVSQGAHVAGDIVDEIVRSGYENNGMLSEDYKTYVKWKKTGEAKIVCKANEEELLNILNTQVEKGYKARYIRDAGRTQVEPNSLTVVGIFPSSTSYIHFSHLQLL